MNINAYKFGQPAIVALNHCLLLTTVNSVKKGRRFLTDSAGQ